MQLIYGKRKNSMGTLVSYFFSFQPSMETRSLTLLVITVGSNKSENLPQDIPTMKKLLLKNIQTNGQRNSLQCDEMSLAHKQIFIGSNRKLNIS
jgi:hypothetical protein